MKRFYFPDIPQGDLREKPIPLVTLPWTGLPDGNDGKSDFSPGYRNVPVVERGIPDRLVPITCIQTHVVYAAGPLSRHCTYYDGGLGSHPVPFGRSAIVPALMRANEILRPYGEELLGLDFWRHQKTQANLFAYILRGILLTNPEFDPRTVYGLIKAGLMADDVGSYATVVKNQTYADAMKEMREKRSGEVIAASALLHTSDDEVLDLYLTIQGNLRELPLHFDRYGNTAHGGGGAGDIVLLNSPLGVGFDHVSLVPSNTEAAMRFFEDEANWDQYKEQAEKNPHLRQYLSEWGIPKVGDEHIITFRNNRRLLSHAMKSVGATYYNGECWHWNFACLDGDDPMSGSGCQSLLKNVRGADGQFQAVWGNDEAHRQMEELLPHFEW